MGSGPMLVDRNEDRGLKMNSIANRDHGFLEFEDRLRGRLLRGLLRSGGNNDEQRQNESQNGRAHQLPPRSFHEMDRGAKYINLR